MKSLYRGVIYPRKCSQCDHNHYIYSDNELLHHMRLHNIRNLVSWWDKNDR